MLLPCVKGYYRGIYATMCKTDSRGRLLHVHREPNPVPCDDLGGGMGWVQEGGDICLLVADSHCRMVAANKIL